MRIKEKYVAEITITFDAKVDYDDGVDFETMKKRSAKKRPLS